MSIGHEAELHSLTRRFTGVETIPHLTPRDTTIAGLESLQRLDYDGFNLTFGAHEHAASRFVELSMLTGDGGVRC